jgi:Leu/Phe-tRNA-protein transferase
MKKFEEVIDKFKSGIMTKEEFNELANISLKYGLKYKIKNNALLRKYVRGILLAVDKEPNLNWWDVSAITNMTDLF